jgi:hypothetical protein
VVLPLRPEPLNLQSPELQEDETHLLEVVSWLTTWTWVLSLGMQNCGTVSLRVAYDTLENGVP